MIEFALAFAAFVLAMAGMAAGVLAGRGAPRGTCGGLNRIPGMDGECGGCSSPDRARSRGNARGRPCPNR
jgi:hypothetical protein